MKNKFLTVLFATAFLSPAILKEAHAVDATQADLNAKTQTQTVTILSIEHDQKKDADNSINNGHAKQWGKWGGKALGLGAAAGAGVGASYIPGAGGAVTGAVVSGVAAPAAVNAGGKLGEKAGNAAAPEKVTVEAIKISYQLPEVCKERHGKTVCKPGKIIKNEQIVGHFCEYKEGPATMLLLGKAKKIQPNASCKAPKKVKNKK